ncbi:MAG: glycosyltransferase [Pedobacter sp.]|nr:MAG: glycosyltransferase [Pedobacter sp.]
MKVIVSNPSVSPHVKENIKAYYDSGKLRAFFTSLICHLDSFITQTLFKIKFLRIEIIKREFSAIPLAIIKTRPFPEIIRTIASRKLNPLFTDKVWEWSELGFDQWVSKKLKKFRPDIIHTYEHAALATLKAASQLAIFKVYEQSSPHHKSFSKTIHIQYKIYPELKTPSTAILLNDLAKKRNQRRDQELILADLILCNSKFTQKTLIDAGINEAKIAILPLGFPLPIKKITDYQLNKPIKFLYCGNQSILKGVHLLLKAWKELSPHVRQAELYFIGSTNEDLHRDTSHLKNIFSMGRMTHDELMKKYKDFDVFILPTLGDGFGMVVTEAMSQGVPVITTTNSCGPDIIEHGKEGWIIEPNSIPAIKNQIQWIINNREQLNVFKQAALEKSKQWQWSDYRKALNQLIETKWKEHQVRKSV